MKKFVYAIGIVAFLVVGGFAVETAVAVQSPTDKVVYDDPPKKETKDTKKSDCTTKPGKSCCDHKGVSSKKSCDDSKATSSKKETKEASDKDKK